LQSLLNIKKLKLNNPTTQRQEILFVLLTNKKVTRRTFYRITKAANPTARIAELRNRYGLDIQCNEKPVTNKFKRQTSFAVWNLPNKAHGFKVYTQLQKNNSTRKAS
jgi:hypothetical protein